MRCQPVTAFCLAALLAPWTGPGGQGAEVERGVITVKNPRTLGQEPLPAERVPVGEDDDYKPCIVVLPNGDLLIVAFHQHKLAGNKIREDILLFRSKDGGRSWSKAEKPPIVGREPYLTVLKDGTLFITVHLLPQDVRNKDGYTHSYLHRSDDSGRTWTTTRIGPDGFPPKAETMTTRNVLELPDGTLLLGVDSAKGPVFTWRSADRGKTWERSQRCDTGGYKSIYSYSGEAVLWRARSGKILNIVRVDSDEHPIAGLPVPKGKGDQRDHLVLYESSDNGRSMRQVRDFGGYGEMYPSVLRLRDGRLLLTFTVRDLKPPLGVQAVLGVEKEDGFSFDFEHDRLVLDSKTPLGKPSGGGFGPTVQWRDGTLLTAYSYRTANDKTRLEAVRWKLPPPAKTGTRPIAPEDSASPVHPRRFGSPGGIGITRGWYVWRKFDPENWIAVVSHEMTGATYTVRVLPWATTYRRLVYGAHPDELLPGERVNLFFNPDEKQKRGYLVHFQDELCQMKGHGHFWQVESVGASGRDFVARVMAGNKPLDSEASKFHVGEKSRHWRGGKEVERPSFRKDDRLFMTWCYEGEKRLVHLTTDDASTKAIRKLEDAAVTQRLAKDGLAAFVESTNAGLVQLLVFPTYWPQAASWKTGQTVGLRSAGAGFRPEGEMIQGRLLARKNLGAYGSGATEIQLRLDRRADNQLLQSWTGGGKVIRVTAR